MSIYSAVMVVRKGVLVHMSGIFSGSVPCYTYARVYTRSSKIELNAQ